MRYTSGHLALGQRPPLSGRLRLNHHRVVLGNALQDGISGDLIVQDSGWSKMKRLNRRIAKRRQRRADRKLLWDEQISASGL